MALRDHMLWSIFTSKPSQPSMSGTAAAYAAGERVFRKNGVNPRLVKAVKVSLVNDRKRRQRRAKAVA